MDKNIVIVEPFYGGSHKQLIDTLQKVLSDRYDLITLSAKKWPWRARCSSLKLSQMIPLEHKYQILFCSSVLNLTEIAGLRPDLQKLKKIIYFHENQLIYPKQQIKDRDFQFGYNQITSCLIADIVVFNSKYNMDSFLNNINKFIKLMPDCRPVQLREQIEKKCTILYFPINFSLIPINTKCYDNLLHIIWPHRWEFDKGPEDFFAIIFKLKELGIKFNLSVLGETFTDVPEIFQRAKDILSDNILHWGYVESKEKYYEVLNTGHVVVSTAKHEFFGVAVLEAVYCGCIPVVPNRLVYPEIYDKVSLYDEISDAVNILKNMAQNVPKIKELRQKLTINLDKYSSEILIPKYIELLTYSIVIISTSSSFFFPESSFLLMLNDIGGIARGSFFGSCL